LLRANAPSSRYKKQKQLRKRTNENQTLRPSPASRRKPFADTFRVHYSIRGSGRNVTVQAESSDEARRVVMDMIPGADVTGVHRVKRSK
jgi:hypothetical protein